MKDTGLIKPETAQDLLFDNEEILKILVTMIKKLKERIR
jgi:hypothetical protein